MRGGGNQSIETDSEIWTTELAGKDINMVITTIFHIFKKLKGRWSMLKRHGKCKKKKKSNF